MVNIKKPILRFAPSPTGHLHIGSARVALFNFLYARHFGGKFILRIEDTDISRSSEDFSKSIIYDLLWLGLNFDEGPYFQSERLDIYKKYAEKLIKNNKAYHDTSSPAIYFKIPPGEVEFEDAIRGKIKFENKFFSDFVIIKSDGTPTYNFACVVDDIEMKITHIIRGDDHISNTPKQILIYQALNSSVPIFAHLPLIMGNDGQRLSKRHGATSISDYRKEGYLKDALINFLARQSFSYDDKQEIFSLSELIEKFDINKISKNPCIFDIDKLLWLNSYYIKNLSGEELVNLLIPYLEEANYPTDDKEKIKKIAILFQPRLKKLSDIIDLSDYFFKDDIEPTDDAKKFLQNEDMVKKVKEGLATLLNISEFTSYTIEKKLRNFCEENNLNTKIFFQTTRALITKKTVSPPLFDIIEIIGKDKICNIIKNAAGGI